MPQMTSSSESSLYFQSVFNTALEAYQNKTKNNLLTHPLASQLQSCNSPAAVLSILQELFQQFDQRHRSDERLRSWLNPTVNVLLSFSSLISEGVGLVFSPSNAIFAGIGILLLAAKDLDSSQDTLIDLFERIETFFRRLESYTRVPPSPAMTDTIVKIMVEVLGILAIATNEVKQRRPKKYLRKLIGKNDIEGALKRLDKLTQEEVRMVTAEVLKVSHSIDDKVKVLIEDGREATEVIQQTANETKEIIQRTASETAVIGHQMAGNVNDVKRSQLQENIQKWLCPPDASMNHNIACKGHYKDTAAWFFQDDIFSQWKSSPSLMWIHGKRTVPFSPLLYTVLTLALTAGSGKSVLCSAIIEDIMVQRKAGSATMAYFYCDFRDKDKQTCRGLLLSIISQLCSQSSLCCDTLSRFYLAHDDGNRKPSDDALMECLNEMLSLPSQSPIYLIVDALDECPNNFGLPTPREEVLDFVKGLVGLRLPNLHLCLTSRPEIDIRTTLESLTSLCISLHNQSGQIKDITDYISSVVYSDKMMQRWREEDRSLVLKTLSERADGMFRWAYCQLEILRQCLPPSVRRILDELPETLDETYERVLKDIKKVNREHAIRLLHCLTVAIRPLRVEELAGVLAIDFDAAGREGIPKLNPNWRWADDHQAVLSTCSSLIAIVDDGDSQVVQFSHFSVKEYLTSDRLARLGGDVSHYHILLEPAHTTLAQVCLGTLLSLDDRVNSINAGNIPLAKYAAKHWVDHARFENVTARIQVAMECLFDANKPHHAAWLRVHDIDEEWFWFTPDCIIPCGEPLYYAALCGFYDLVKHLAVKHPEHVNAWGGQIVSPLGAALYRNHFQVAGLLHEHGADIHVRGDWERTLLHASTKGGNVDAVRWLLSHGADANARQDDSWTSLHLAAFNSHLEIARILLEHGADVNSRNDDGEDPLHRAACARDHHDHINMMQLLLEHGTDVNARDNEGSTPLHYSSSRRGGDRTHSSKGTVEGTRLLLQHGASINAENSRGETPRQVALIDGHESIAEFLLECGAK